MNLREYLDDNVLQIREFTKQVGVTEHTVYNWLNGLIMPVRINQLKIQKLTDGKVTTEDWGNNERKKKANRRVSGSKDNEVRPRKHMDVDKKAIAKGSKKKR